MPALFNVTDFLNAPGLDRHHAVYQPGDTIFQQGDIADSVVYIQHGSVRLSLYSAAGKEAIVAALGDGDFCGEGAIAGQASRRTTATAVTECRILILPKHELAQLLHDRPTLAARFIRHMLTRNRRLEDDLADHIFCGSEKRLARTLLLLAGQNGKRHEPLPTLAPIPQEILAEMVGTTRARVNGFMNAFRKRGYVDYDRHQLVVHDSLRDVMSREGGG